MQYSDTYEPIMFLIQGHAGTVRVSRTGKWLYIIIRVECAANRISVCNE